MMDTITTMPLAIYVPAFSAFAGLEPSLPLTRRMPMTEAMIPTAAMISGKIAAVASSKTPPDAADATAASVIAEMMDPQ